MKKIFPPPNPLSAHEPSELNPDTAVTHTRGLLEQGMAYPEATGLPPATLEKQEIDSEQMMRDGVKKLLKGYLNGSLLNDQLFQVMQKLRSNKDDVRSREEYKEITSLKSQHPHVGIDYFATKVADIVKNGFSIHDVCEAVNSIELPDALRSHLNQKLTLLVDKINQKLDALELDVTIRMEDGRFVS